MLGMVKFFNSKKGWGYISADDSFEEYFFHYSDIIMDGFKNLIDGQQVSFDAEKDEKGLKAKNVRKIG
jgi:cold shock CspA family protein